MSKVKKKARTGTLEEDEKKNDNRKYRDMEDEGQRKINLRKKIVRFRDRQSARDMDKLLTDIFYSPYKETFPFIISSLKLTAISFTPNKQSHIKYCKEI